MPETFAPFTWIDGAGGGTPITAAQLNRLELGLESMDDRAAALELGILAPVAVSYAATLTLNAATGSVFRIAATGNLVITDITGGLDGQSIQVWVKASSTARNLTVAGATTTIAADSWWIGLLSFNAPDNFWALLYETTVPPTGGGSSSSGTYPASYPASY